MFRLLLLTTIVNLSKVGAPGATRAMTFEAVDFEIFGVVQGVFFRKFTKQKADELGVHGWCKNTSKGTVVGHVQGHPQQVQQMLRWLRSEGSPNSKIDRAEFTNRSEIAELTFNSFEIRK